MTHNPPIIRPGQRVPYRRGTRRQIEQRTGAAAALVFAGFSKSQVHSVFKKLYGVQWRQADRYMARVRARNVFP